jgi:hypothetical protein
MLRRDNMRPTMLILALFGLLLFTGTALAAEDGGPLGATVGADIKFYLFDQTQGTVDGVDQSNDMSAGISSAIIYISKDISDNVSVELQPEILVSAAATARLGGEITRETDAEIETEFLRANITWLVGDGFEIKAGVVKPLFTWDYGYELFWHEEYHGSFVSANPWLGAWHDSGVEVYKNFDFESVSLPVYLYVLNGPSGVEVDNNEGYSILVHVAPELLNGQLKFLGSLGTGKWDDDNKKDFIRYALGASYQTGPVAVRGEYMGGKWEDEFFVTDAVTGDIKPKGYYIKVLYDFLPRFRALAGYNHLKHDFTGFFFTDTMAEETYDGYVLGVNFALADGTTVMLTYNHLEGDRSDDSATLDTDRLTLGVRTDF